jgi:hypothetical protein
MRCDSYTHTKYQQLEGQLGHVIIWNSGHEKNSIPTEHSSLIGAEVVGAHCAPVQHGGSGTTRYR